MKYATFAHAGRTSWGVVEGDTIVDVGAVLPDYAGLKQVIAAGALVRAATVARAPGAPRYPLAGVEFLPVIPDPSKIFCVGHNYESHRQETGRERTEHPSIFVRFADSQVGHNTPIVRPFVSTMLDYEGELAVVIGAGGRAIPVETALDHIAGYSCYMDASVRDWQWHTKQFTPGKTFPGTGGFGPWMVTPDELGDPRETMVTTRLNGQTLQAQPVSDMIFSIAAIINYISTFSPLSPGDVIVTGTPGGVGAKRNPPVWMAPGDHVEVEITGVGRLAHDVVDETPSAMR
jgi:2-keto-4-pentenoate hydratase/2-oxohepta-3-ene-1,7-dioic acid hydratase in catechol pathway